MNLSIIHAELDGSSSLCYLLMAVGDNSRLYMKTNVAGKVSILEQLLQPMESVNSKPLYFDCDKDKAEISAITQVWLDVTVGINSRVIYHEIE